MRRLLGMMAGRKVGDGGGVGNTLLVNERWVK